MPEMRVMIRSRQGPPSKLRARNRDSSQECIGRLELEVDERLDIARLDLHHQPDDARGQENLYDRRQEVTNRCAQRSQRSGSMCSR